MEKAVAINITSNVKGNHDKPGGADADEDAGEPDPVLYARPHLADPTEQRQAQLHLASQQRTDNWTDNTKDLKKRKEQERFAKFEKEELQRRAADQQERLLQQVRKEEELGRANAKLFQDTEQVRALNSKLLMSDALYGREEQLELKKAQRDVEQRREQFYHE
jgi:hypothetical protein